MLKKLKHLMAAGAMATLIAAGVDLVLSAMNGYMFRSDIAAMVAFELAGIGSIVFFALGAAHLVASAVRRPALTASAPAALCLFAAWSPIAVILLWRHRDVAALSALGAAAVFIGCLAAAESRMRWRPARALIVMLTAVAAAAAILWAAIVPFPGRDMVPRANRPSGDAGATDTRPNLVLVVLDTTRADHLGAYGYARRTTPWLDQFARNATVFERAAAASSYTLPTHATLFTGLYPETHGAIVSAGNAGFSLKELDLFHDQVKVLPLSEEVTTLAETLREAGYETAALCANSAYLARAFNLDQGFDTYVDARGSVDDWRPAGISVMSRIFSTGMWRLTRILVSSERYCLFGHEINELAQTWMRGRSTRPYFLFLNYMEPHTPYLPLPPHRHLFPNSYGPLKRDLSAISRGEDTMTPEELSTHIDAYDAELRCLDDRLRDLFSELERMDALDNTLVVIAGDHGEGFGEHGFFDHANSLYEEEVHVPLIVREPGQRSGVRVSRRVHTVDVMPTILRILGISIPAGMEGGDLFLGGRTIADVASLGPYSRAYSEYAVYEGNLKLVLRTDAAAQLFDLAADPREQSDLAAVRPGDVTRLTTLFDEYVQRPGRRFRSDSSAIDADTRERLESLGYADH